MRIAVPNLAPLRPRRDIVSAVQRVPMHPRSSAGPPRGHLTRQRGVALAFVCALHALRGPPHVLRGPGHALSGAPVAQGPLRCYQGAPWVALFHLKGPQSVHALQGPLGSQRRFRRFRGPRKLVCSLPPPHPLENTLRHHCRPLKSWWRRP